MAWALCIGERRASRAPWAQREALMSAEAVATLDEAMAMLESALILTLTLTRTLTRTLAQAMAMLESALTAPFRRPFAFPDGYNDAIVPIRLNIDPPSTNIRARPLFYYAVTDRLLGGQALIATSAPTLSPTLTR